MKVLVTGLMAATLYGQHMHLWQEDCFKNPGLPYCPGHEFAVKRQPGGGKDLRNGSVADIDVPAVNVTQADIIAGAIDWRFADPSAGALAGLHAKKLAALPMARKVIAQIGSIQGLSPSDVNKLTESLSIIEQVAISIKQNQTLVMVTGRGADSIPPQLEAGWKAVAVVENALVIGPAYAVDQAVRRMSLDNPPSDSMRLAMRRQAVTEFWAFATAASHPTGAPLKGFSLDVWIDERLRSALALEFDGAPDGNTLSPWSPVMKGALEGNVLHVLSVIEPIDVQQRLSPVAAKPLGDYLTTLVQTTRHLPGRDGSVRTPAKPIIYGLE
jgi:hypothetical protein